MARLTEKNQYDRENASTWMPTQLASPHESARRAGARHQRDAPDHTATPTPSTPSRRGTPRPTTGVVGVGALGAIAGMVFQNESHGQVNSRTQPVAWAVYQAVQLPVSR